MSRLLFTKEGSAVWSSHLDLMRALMRSFRRAGITLKHSQGFTPHPELSILMPLSVGVESQCEIAEFTLAEGCAVPVGEIADRMNPVLPAGIRAIESWDGGQKAGKLAWLRARLTLTYEASGIRHQASDSPVGCGSYPKGEPPAHTVESSVTSHQSPGDGGTDSSTSLRSAQNDRVDALTALFARPSLIVEKHGKKGVVETDIAPMIRDLTVSAAGAVIGRPDEGTGQGSGIKVQGSGDGENGFLTSLEMTGEDAVVIEAVVAAQNPTLNPLLLVTAIETHLPAYKPDQVQCRRIEVYDTEMNPFR